MTWEPITKRKLTIEQKKAIKKLWYRHDLSFLLHPGQIKLKKFLETNDNHINVICFSRQYGKTNWAVNDAFEFALKNPKSFILFVSYYNEQMVQAIQSSLNIILHTMPPELQPTKVKNQLKFSNKSVIIMKGLYPDSGKLRGMTINRIYIDEAREIPNLEEVIENTLEPMTNTTNGKIFLISTPPESPGHSFTSRYIKEAIEKNAFYVANYKTNPFLQDQLILEEKIKSYKGGTNSVAWKREQEADYTIADTTRLVIPSFNKELNEQRYIEYKRNISMYLRPQLSIDIGNKDHTAIIAGWYDELADILVIEREKYFQNPTTKEIAENIKKIEYDISSGFVYTKIQRTIDIDHRLANDLLSDYDILVNCVVKERSNTAMLAKLDDQIYKGRIVINPSCEVLIHELSTGIWTSNYKDYERLSDGNHLDGQSALKYMEISLVRQPLINKQGYDVNSNNKKILSNPFLKR